MNIVSDGAVIICGHYSLIAEPKYTPVN